MLVKKLHIPLDKKIILYPGRLTEWKGQIEFLNVLKKLKNSDFFCVFAGDDKNHTYKKKLIVYFLKFIRGDKKFRHRGELIRQMNKDVIFAKKGLKAKLVI